MGGTLWLWLMVLSRTCAGEDQCADGTCNSGSLSEASPASLMQKSLQMAFRSTNPTCSIDVMFLLDISCSLNADHWAALQHASASFISSLKTKDAQLASKSKVGALTFSIGAKLWAALTTNLDSVANTINGIDFNKNKKCQTNIDAGFDQAKTEFQTHSGKTPQQRIALVMTDGAPYGGSDAKGRAQVSAEALRKYARVVLIGVGKQSTIDKWTAFMKTLASQPYTDNFYAIEKFSGLTDDFIGTLVDDLCKTPPPTPRPTPTPAPTICEKDTHAPCYIGDVCFQRTRGDTFCDEGTKTCHCKKEDECVVNISFATTSEGKWSVCRKWGQPEKFDDTRGEKSTITWLRDLTMDIMGSYATILETNSAR